MPPDAPAESLPELAERYGIEFLEQIDDQLFDPDLIRNLSVDWARTRRMLPVRHNGQVAVLLADPGQIDDQSALAMLLGCEPIPLLAPPREIESAIQRCYANRQESTHNFIRDLGENQAGTPSLSAGDAAGQTQDLLRAVSSAPVTQLVNLILLEAVQRGASDVHIEPCRDRLRLRYRIDGMLQEQSSPPKHMEAALISRLKVMARLDIAEKRLPQDGMTQLRIGERELDVRLSTIPVADGERVVLRLLNTEQLVRPLGELGMPESIRKPFAALLGETRGAIWVTGPTGSGKTTTLYAALQSLDTRCRNVLTIEDPIEYRLPEIGQIAVKPKIGLTFAQGLRHILRQDPDVILVGETRDLETAEIAVRASLTGHLVLSTLHTNDALGAVIRLVDMGIPAYLVAAATRAILAQRLARQLCTHCARPTDPTADQREVFGNRLDGLQPRCAVGCDRCLEGYQGRTAFYEWICLDEELRRIIRHGASPEQLASATTARNPANLLSAALEQVRNGQTSLEEVLRVLGREIAP
jgi:general secretion pathway protein E